MAPLHWRISIFGGDFRHYILIFWGGSAGAGPAAASRIARCGSGRLTVRSRKRLSPGRRGQDHVQRAHLGQLLRAACAAPCPGRCASIHCCRVRHSTSARKQTRMWACVRSWRVMKHRPQAQVVLADAEAVLDLRQADVGLPEFGGARARRLVRSR